MQLIVKLTTACNLNCVYCSEGDKKKRTLPLEYIYKIVDECPELAKATNDRNIVFLWHGGEPLLVGKEYLTAAMIYAQEKLSDYNVKFLLQSNGTMIDDEWIYIFKKFNVKVGISLDGYKELHDKNRKDKDGKHTFDTVIENIHHLQRNNVYGGSLMVLNTTYTLDENKIIELICENDLHIKIHSVIPCGRAENIDDTDIISDKYTELLKNLYRKIMEQDLDVDLEPLSGIMRAILSNSTVSECSYNGSCGKGFLCIYADGETGFCGRSEEIKNEYGYGNISDNSLTEIYFSQNAQRIRNRKIFLENNDCKTCKNWQFCMGGCSFEAYNQYGILEHKFPSCKQRNEIIDFLKNEGIELLKQRLIREKSKYRAMIRIKKALLEDIRNARK